MRIHLFRTSPLVQELSQGDPSPELQARYLLATFLFFPLVYYAGLVASVAPLWSLPSLLEAAVVVGVTILGLAKAYEAAGGPKSRSFLVRFSCLYVPVSITTLVPIWASYWALRVLFNGTLVALSESHLQFAINLSRIGSDFIGLLTFVATVAVQGITYLRIAKLLSAVRHAEVGANPSIERTCPGKPGHAAHVER